MTRALGKQLEAELNRRTQYTPSRVKTLGPRSSRFVWEPILVRTSGSTLHFIRRRRPAPVGHVCPARS